METDFRAEVLFHWTGKRQGFGLDSIEGLNLLPALLARYRHLAKLRYDYPLVLIREDSGGGWVRSLSEVFDGMFQGIAEDADADRLVQHGLRIEREIRTLLAHGANGSLSALWESAANQLSSDNDLFRDSAKRLGNLRQVDGQVVACDKETPARLLRHAWETVQQRKARPFLERVNRLVAQLSDILRAGFARSEGGRSPEVLRASVGSAFEKAFDFEAMSRLLSAAGSESLPRERFRRIQWLLSVLQSHRFFAAQSSNSRPALQTEPHSFIFESCASAIEAYRERQPEMLEFAKALAMAELEIDGRYEGARHDPFFEQFGMDSLSADDAALFPDYLVHLNTQRMSATETAILSEALSVGLPMKVLIQTDDLVKPSPFGDGDLTLGLRGNRFASSMIGNDVYVLQSSSSALVQLRDHILRGMEYTGPALFCVFSGAAESTNHLPPYLVAAAAMESRAFPAFVYDPSAGRNWASRFYLQGNSQPEADWPVHNLSYEDEAHQKISENPAFTLVDFLACDRRFARDFATVPRSSWDGDFATVPELLNDETMAQRNKVPCVLLVGANDELQKVIVDDKLVREARRCREMWRSLQELAGIHNSHAERLLAKERKAWEEQLRPEAGVRPDGHALASEPPNSPPLAPAASTTSQSTESEAALPSDEAFIETPRCTSCDECINLNKQMFAYNTEKQAFLANPDAGPYRQLVEAAESCPVSIIHPGKPRNPNEPGLDDLQERAAPFR